MDAKQSKNFFAQLVEDLPATATNSPNVGQPGKSIAKPFLRETADSTLRIEVWNYTSTPYLKGDIVVVNVDNYGICRVIDALSDSGMYVSVGATGTSRPELNKMIYASGDTAANQLAAISVSANNTLSPQTKMTQYANPFNFRPGAPALFANARGFGYCYTDGAGNADQDKPYKMAEGLIPVAQDSRLHFRIPANDTKVYNFGDPVFVVSNGVNYELGNAAYDHDGAIVAICDSEKKAAVDFDFWMPFNPAGFVCSIDEQTFPGTSPGNLTPGDRFGYSRDNNGNVYYDYQRGDFVFTNGRQQLFNPIYVQQYRVTAGTSYPVAVYFDGNTVNPYLVDIPLSLSQWLANYGRGSLKPEICDGDLIACLVDASGSTPFITPISFPMDYGFGVRMFFSAPPSGRLWQADQPQNNDIISITGSWNGKVAIDPNGTDLNIVAGGGIYEKITDNTVLVQG